MVTVISGGMNSNSERIFTERIRESVGNGENVLVIVPDQFSFEYDKMLYRVLGAKKFNSIKTAGFNRLAGLISEKYGSGAGENANENAKIILMYKAINRFRSCNVKFYRKSLEKGSFISEMNKLVSQLRESGITPEELKLASESLEGTVSLKLHDIAEIYGFYLEELSVAGMKDSLSSVSESVMLAEKNGYFDGMSVFVTSFNDFTYDENRMIDLCISQSRSFTISLLIDNESVKNFKNNPFGTVIKTRQAVYEKAVAHNIPFEEITADETYFRSEEIEYLSRNIFNLSRNTYNGKKGDVKVLSATDIYEETEYICAEISRLVREDNYRYSDIAVVVRDINSCSSVFEGIFERYEIPYFIDSSDRVTASSIVHYFNIIFRTVLTKQYKTDNIMKYIKSPLFSMLNYEISELEDYCIKWNVDGDMWKSDFTADKDRNKGEYLKKINGYRRKIIEPLETFRNAVQDATAGEICRALYDLLGKIQISQQTYSVVKRASTSENETQLELARGLKQLWQSVLSAVKSIYEIIGDEEISLKQFYDLFSLMLSQMSVSNPPQKLDCVRIADAGHSRLTGTKVVFVAEVNDGIFPAVVRSGGLITEHEKEEIQNLPENRRVIFYGNIQHDFMTEKLLCYTAFSLAEEKLYALYSQSDLVGKEKRPSMLIREIREILGVKEELIRKIPIDFFATSYKTAYYKFLEHSKDNDSSVKSLYDALMKNDEYRLKIESLRNVREDGNFELSEELADKQFFKSEITKVSPTKLETYFKCPFSYFCKYGLKLEKKERMTINGVNKGNLIHGMLEKLLKNEQTNTAEGCKSRLAEMTDDDIREFIGVTFEEFYNEQLCGDFGKTRQFRYIYEKLKDTAFDIIGFVKSELFQSKFEPVLLEYNINSEEDGDKLVLLLDNNKKIYITGQIDRADVYTGQDGKKYVRIIDYKSGEIDISLNNLYNGLNLQMFVYLSYLLETKNIINSGNELQQAGTVYFSLKEDYKIPDETGDNEKDTENLQNSILKSFKPKGCMVDIPEIEDAFSEKYEEKKSCCSYMPFSSNSKDLLLSNENFTALRKFTEQKIKEYGNSLLKGKINALPVSGTCSYCSYAGICGNAFPDNAKDMKDTKYKEMMEDEIKRIADKEEKTDETTMD